MCSSLRDDHKRSKRITDSTDATDLFFHGFLFDAFGLCALRRMDFYGFSFITVYYECKQAETEVWNNAIDIAVF